LLEAKSDTAADTTPIWQWWEKAMQLVYTVEQWCGSDKEEKPRLNLIYKEVVWYGYDKGKR